MHCLSSLGGIKGHFVKNDRKFVVDVDFFFIILGKLYMDLFVNGESDTDC